MWQPTLSHGKDKAIPNQKCPVPLTMNGQNICIQGQRFRGRKIRNSNKRTSNQKANASFAAPMVMKAREDAA